MTASPQNRRLFAAAITLVTWIGLGTQLYASYASAGTLPETLWVMLRYFTVIVNLFVAIMFTAIALGRPHIASPFNLAGVTISILLVGIVYNLLLRGCSNSAAAQKSPTSSTTA